MLAQLTPPTMKKITPRPIRSSMTESMPHKKKPVFREERAAEQRNGRKDTQAGAQNIVPRVGAAVLTLAFPHHAGYTVFRFKHFGLQIGIRLVMPPQR